MRDGGARYVLNQAPPANDPLVRAAELAISLKETLGTDAPADVRIATDLLLFSLGSALGRPGDEETT